MIATVVLARLLAPADFGLVAMVTTFSYLLINFGLNGLTEAVVQREDISNRLASTLFWLNIVCGIVLTFAFAAAGYLMAGFFHDPLVVHVAWGVSLTIVFTSASVMHLALLKRAMRFSVVSFNDIGGRVMSVAVSIALGLAGWGYWALVAGLVAQQFSIAVGAWILCRWVPERPRRVAGLGEMVKFALHTYGNFSVNYASRNTDNLLVGWRFSAEQLGFYKKAYDLFALSATQLVSSISVVVVSALSRVNRDMDQYKRYFFGAVTAMAFIGMGLGANLTLVGSDLIRVLLGAKWGPAGQIFTFFGPGVGVMILYYTHGWIHLSIGRPDRWFRWAIFEFFVTVALFLVALPYGPKGMAVAWTVSFWILTIPGIWYAGRPIGLKITPVLKIVWRYLAASLIASAATYLAIGHMPQLMAVGGVSGALLRVVVISALVDFLYIGAVVALHGGFAPVEQMVQLVREVVAPARSTAAASTAALPEDELPWPAVGAPSVVSAEPLVSILIPAYNAEEWIGDTIRSAIAQTWCCKEIIVVDDGSRDRTVEVASRFRRQGVTVVQQKNQGAAAARNMAMSLSRGDYIQWLDADDLLAADKIERQMEVWRNGATPKTLVSGPWGGFMYRPHRANFRQTSLWADQQPIDWMLHKLSENIFMQTATWLASRELTEAAGLWDTRLIGDDDGEYFCRVLLASDGVRFVPEARVYYRTFGFNNLSYIGNNPRKIDAHWLSMKMHMGYLQSLEQSERVRRACLTYLRTSLIYFYPERTDIVREAQQIAEELGEPLGIPELAWKYSWIERLFGWKMAKPAQRSLRRLRWSVEKHIDKLMLLGDGRKGVVPDPKHMAVPERQAVVERS